MHAPPDQRRRLGPGGSAPAGDAPHEIEEAYELFANQRDGVLKVAITP
jgi:hypothetical protein